MQLTADQKQALERGEAVRLTEPQTRAECVLIRADVYERVKRIMPDDSDFTPQDAYPFVNDAMREDDQHDPYLDSYQKYRP